MKIKFKSVTIHVDETDEDARARFRAIKRKLKAMDRGDIAQLLLEAVERHVDDERDGGRAAIGFRPDTGDA